MNLTKFNLLLCSVLIIVLYFQVPFYNDWLWGKALSKNNNMLDQMQNLDVAYRKQYRFGGSYMVYMDIQRILSKRKDSITLLLPTTDYLKSIKITDIDMPEPAIFYYFTGINAVWASSPEVDKANTVLIASKQTGLRLLDIKAKPQLDSFITLYKKYIK